MTKSFCAVNPFFLSETLNVSGSNFLLDLDIFVNSLSSRFVTMSSSIVNKLDRKRNSRSPPLLFHEFLGFDWQRAQVVQHRLTVNVEGTLNFKKLDETPEIFQSYFG